MDGWKVAELVMMALMSIIAWLGKRSLDRLDDLERTAVTRDEQQSMHRENQATLRRIEDKLDSSQPGVIASRLERAEDDIRDLRNWKHQVDPFIVRRIDP